jgi:hypothetical protein
MDDTWFSRELPVLDAVARFLDDSGGMDFPTIQTIAEITGLDVGDVGRAAITLDGSYIDLTKLLTGGDYGPWIITKITPRARQEVGQWPTPESVIDRLAAGLAQAADHEADSVRSGRIKETASLLSGSVRDVAVEVAAAVISRHMGGA